jgi:hypothetical protein
MLSSFKYRSPLFTFLALVSLVCLTGCLTACTDAQSTGVQGFFDVLGTAAAAAGMPWATPLLHGVGSGVANLMGTHGAMAVAAVAVKHHVDFGLTPGRRKKLAPAREAHRAAKKKPVVA